MPTFVPPRALALDLVRGICALGIAAYHFIYWTYGYDLQSLATFGVYVFFVLSGLAMMLRYAEEFQDGLTFERIIEFYRNRVARIMPLLFTMAAIAFLYLQYRQGGQSPGKAFLTGTGLFALHLPGALSNTPGAWSIGIELAFYAVFPVIGLLSARVSIGALLLSLGLLIIGQQVALAVLPPPSDPAFWGQYSMPLTFAPFFAGGILIYRLGNRSWSNAWIGAAVCLTVIFGFTIVRPENVMKGGWPFLFLSVVAFAAVLLAYRSQLPSWLNRSAVFLGEISYAVYLSHWIIYDFAARLPQPARPVGFIISVLLAGAFINRYFEKPLRDFIRDRRQPELYST